ncbi:MAG: ribokinase [Hyphomicrobiaceae bacterium]
MTKRPRILVIGSAHMDLIASAERQPRAGESLVGTFAMAPGGKGGNQACQCALAGAETKLLTRLGQDDFGHALRSALASKGVDTSLIVTDRAHATGASTVLAANGEYASIIAPGAAAHLTTDDVERARPDIEAADALILQLELPHAVSARAAAIAAQAGKTVILNASPSPARWIEVPDALWQAATIVVVNAVEAGGILGSPVAAGNAAAAAASLAARHALATTVITLGAKGSVAWHEGHSLLQPALSARVTDSVGAGDAFLGTFVVARLGGLGMTDALRRAAAAGTLAVTRRGAYAALPSKTDVDRHIADLNRGTSIGSED